MKKFKFVFCFLNDKGEIERDENGNEQVHIDLVEEQEVGSAVRKFMWQFKGLKQPEVLEIIEIKGE